MVNHRSWNKLTPFWREIPYPWSVSLHCIQDKYSLYKWKICLILSVNNCVNIGSVPSLNLFRPYFWTYQEHVLPLILPIRTASIISEISFAGIFYFSTGCMEPWFIMRLMLSCTDAEIQMKWQLWAPSSYGWIPPNVTSEIFNHNPVLWKYVCNK